MSNLHRQVISTDNSNRVGHVLFTGVDCHQVETGRKTKRAGYTCIFVGEAWGQNIFDIVMYTGSGAHNLGDLEAAPRGQGESPVTLWEKGSSLGLGGIVLTIL